MTLLNNQVHLRKKSIIRFYFSAATVNFWSQLNDLVWIFGIKSIKRPVLSFFSNSRSLERPGLIIETLEYIQCCSIFILPFFKDDLYPKTCKQESKSNHKITINQFTNSKRCDGIYISLKTV